MAADWWSSEDREGDWFEVPLRDRGYAVGITDSKNGRHLEMMEVKISRASQIEAHLAADHVDY